MGYIYFLISPDDYAMKVGFTENPYGRRASLKTWSYGEPDFEDIFPGTKEDEESLHCKLGEWSIRREWFWMTQEVYDVLLDLRHARVVLNVEEGRELDANVSPISQLLAVENPRDRCNAFIAEFEKRYPGKLQFSKSSFQRRFAAGETGPKPGEEIDFSKTQVAR